MLLNLARLAALHVCLFVWDVVCRVEIVIDQGHYVGFETVQHLFNGS